MEKIKLDKKSKASIELDKKSKASIESSPKVGKAIEPTNKGQTCLEKVGMRARKQQIKNNTYNGANKSKEYSATHKDALSNPNEMFGKGTNSGGHTFFRPNFGKPLENPNAMNYSNFRTLSDKGGTIGNKCDIQTRNESFLMRRYNHQNNEYSNLNIDAISNGDVQGKSTGIDLDTTDGGGGYDLVARYLHLTRNGWNQDLQYTKALVNAEYDIQTEFEISSVGENMGEDALEEYERDLYNDVEKEQKDWEKALRKQEKEDKKAKKKKDKEQEKIAKQLDKKIKKQLKLQEKQIKNQYDENGNKTLTESVVNNDLSWLKYADGSGYAQQGSYEFEETKNWVRKVLGGKFTSLM